MPEEAPKAAADAMKDERDRPKQPQTSQMSAPVTVISGIGERLAGSLGRLGIASVRDLLMHLPRRYLDLSKTVPLDKLRSGEEVTVSGTVRSSTVNRPRGGRLTVTTVGIYDGRGYLEAVWFNQPYIADKLNVGDEVVLAGRIESKATGYRIQNPIWEQLPTSGESADVQGPVGSPGIHTGRIVPVHPATEGVSPKALRRLIHTALKMMDAAQAWHDVVPDDLAALRHMPSAQLAMDELHFPTDSRALKSARRRIVYAELLTMQTALAMRRRSREQSPGIPHQNASQAVGRLLESLPFHATEAQSRAIAEISRDMSAIRPMNRILQGDVGSGKTLVAAAASVIAANSGYQAAIMAPTESLATQHAARLTPLLGALGLRVGLLTGSTPAKARRELLAELANGSIDLLIGTHALIQSTVGFARLSLVIVDEQHRFGVTQRSELREKGAEPDVLVMTATPIPRTLALTLYGDLDVSTLDEMPQGRAPIRTKWIQEDQRQTAYDFIEKKLAEGRQAYIICPLIEGSSSSEKRAAMDEVEMLREHVFKGREVAVLHGRMRPAEKRAALASFESGDASVLVSTTVVEVGIDVPNASVILIEGADLFGISQLHQLRGRVGRGAHRSYCLLMSSSTDPTAQERLRTLESSSDGFELAEADMRLRGQGDLLGERQSGSARLRYSTLPRDLPILAEAREDAFKLISEDPTLSSPEHSLLRTATEEWLNAGSGREVS